ncbi:MAG: serine protease inhibitor ecotin [Aeromonadaceae bacterium]
MKSCTLLCTLLALGVSSPLLAGESKDLKMFPPANQQQQRKVIRLPALEQEQDRKVEILISKPLEVDCNRQRLSADLIEDTVKGWGYSYYTLTEVKGPLSTMMACPKNEKHQAQVPVYGEGFLLGYNSRLPVVIYAPKDVTIQYRIWQPGAVIDAPTE